ncbi:unnamed protein product [Peniophora sp. CBMAI 1063]|nr:unnamed protein product [Peniophora sp. CBMAI 1063]
MSSSGEETSGEERIARRVATALFAARRRAHSPTDPSDVDSDTTQDSDTESSSSEEYPLMLGYRAAVEARERSYHAAQHNSDTVTHRLPVEVLCLIFEWVAHPGRSSGGLCDDGSGQMLLYITHVCRHWRSIAIAHATLWTAIPYQNKALSELFWNRAHGAQPSISLCLDQLSTIPLVYNTTFFRVLPCQYRVSAHTHKETPLSGAQARRLAGILGMVDPMSNLHTLELDYRLTSPTTLSHDFFAKSTSRLRCLFLKGVVFPWGCAPTALRELFLGGFQGESMSPQQFTEGLRLLPWLEVLSLDSITFNGASARSDGVVPLPNLIRLVLKGDYDGCAYWCSVVQHPVEASLDIQIYERSMWKSPCPDDEVQGKISTLLESLHTRQGRPEYCHATLALGAEGEDPTPRVECCLRSSIERLDAYPYLRLLLSDHGPPADRGTVVPRIPREICGALRQSEWVVVEITSPGFTIGVEDVHHILNGAVSLQELRLTGMEPDAVDAVFEFLNGDQNDHASLKRIVLREVDFGCRLHSRCSGEMGAIASLSKVLGRGSGAHKLASVVFQNCAISSDHIRTWQDQDLCDELKWDGNMGQAPTSHNPE